MVKRLIGKLLYGYRYDSEGYLKYLRSNGASIGEDVNIFGIRRTNIDVLNPHLLTIGNHVNIVASTILTHDYAWSVVKRLTGEILGNQKSVVIGNNVFIGDGCIVLCGSTIEDNVIIGAHSVVSGHLMKDSVYAGNPARYIMSIEDYAKKRRLSQDTEARQFCVAYKAVHGCYPSIDAMHEYFFLFEDDKGSLPPPFREKLKLCGNYEKSAEALESGQPLYLSYEDFLERIDRNE